MDENETAINAGGVASQDDNIKPVPLIPEVMPDVAQQSTTGAVIPMSEWNKLYQGHLEFKTSYVGREASIAERRTTLLNKLEQYDHMLEEMNSATDGEIDRLSKFKDERFGK